MAEPIKRTSSDDMLAELEQLQTGAATSTSRARPIGVPTSMRDPRTGQDVPFAATRYASVVDEADSWARRREMNIGVDVVRQVAPTFFDGDEYVPSQWAREDIGRLQIAMRNAGLFTKKQRTRFGVWDETSRNAYRKLLEYANGAGMQDPIDALREYARAREEAPDDPLFGGEDEAQRAPLVTRRTNPADLRRAADAAIPAVIGRKLSSDQLDRLVAAYHQIEEQEQRQAYQLDETGGTVTQAPSFQAFAEERAKAMDPQGAAEMQVVDRMEEFYSLLGGQP